MVGAAGSGGGKMTIRCLYFALKPYGNLTIRWLFQYSRKWLAVIASTRNACL
jgi:hypothetical protein